MKTLDIIRTANSNLLRSKTRTILTILAIIIGTITLTLTVAIGNGAKDYINNQIKAVDIPNGLFIVKKNPNQGRDGNPFAPTDTLPKYTNQIGIEVTPLISSSDMASIQQIKGIKKVYGEHTNLQTLYVTLNGNDKYAVSAYYYVPEETLSLAAGTIPSANDSTSVILPYKAIKTLGYSSPSDLIGKTVSFAFITSSNINKVTGTPTPTLKQFHVSGVMVTNLLVGDNAIFPVSVNNAIFNELDTTPTDQQSFSNVAAITDSLSSKDQSALQTTLSNKGYNSNSISSISSSIQGVITTVQVGLSLFAAIAILAATLGIVNTLLMAVLERSREIGLMKALGMGKGGIFSMFAFEAISIGFWGGIIGILLGVGIGSIANNLARKYFLKGFEGYSLLTFPISFLIIILVIDLFIAFLAGAIPALKASRMNPIDALRVE